MGCGGSKGVERPSPGQRNDVGPAPRQPSPAPAGNLAAEPAQSPAGLRGQREETKVRSPPELVSVEEGYTFDARGRKIPLKVPTYQGGIQCYEFEEIICELQFRENEKLQ